MNDFKGQVVVVTGGSRGLGYAIAEAFVDAGARVAITGRNADTLQASVARLAERGTVGGFVADVAQEEAVERLVNEVESALGPVDVLVNNAGINPWYKAAEQTSMNEWDQIIDVNLTGVLLGCRIFGGRKLERGRGAIVNVTSVAAHTGLVRSAAYCAAKGGVEAMTRSLAVEWARKGVRVNCVAPAYFETDLTTGLRANDRLSGNVVGRTPMARYGQPHELSGACLFLASQAASYVTGHSLLVDGGWVAG